MGIALFDRLAAGPGEAYAASDSAVAESIRLELERLLNTRRTTREHRMPASIIDYGIDDWSNFYADREADRRALLRDVRQTIERFEPRLRLSALDVEAVPGQRRKLILRIAGQLRGSEALLELVMSFGDSSFEVRYE